MSHRRLYGAKKLWIAELERKNVVGLRGLTPLYEVAAAIAPSMTFLSQGKPSPSSPPLSPPPTRIRAHERPERSNEVPDIFPFYWKLG